MLIRRRVLNVGFLSELNALADFRGVPEFLNIENHQGLNISAPSLILRSRVRMCHSLLAANRYQLMSGSPGTFASRSGKPGHSQLSS